MKQLMAILVCLLMAGCATTNRLVSYMQSNPIVVNIATKQAVFRYINAGKTDTEKVARSERVQAVLNKVEYFLEGNPTASSQTLLLVVKANVDLDKLEPADRLLVEDIFSVIESNMTKYEQSGLLSNDAVIRIRVLIRTLLQAAELVT